MKISLEIGELVGEPVGFDTIAYSAGIYELYIDGVRGGTTDVPAIFDSNGVGEVTFICPEAIGTRFGNVGAVIEPVQESIFGQWQFRRSTSKYTVEE